MKTYKKIMCLVLACGMLLLCSCNKAVQQMDNTDSLVSEQIKYTTPAGTATKNETVYVNLDSTGKVTQTIVSDWIHTNKAQVYVDDMTNLSQIENIKDDSMPDVSGQNLRWYMDSTDLYYQGYSTNPLPVNFELSYTLNGTPISGEELVGKSGQVTITIRMHNTHQEIVKVNGVDMPMYTPMIVVGGVALNETKFQNISVMNGKAIGNGNSQLAVLVGFPGINESLGLTEITQNANTQIQYSFNDTFVISADVKDFELGNFMFSAIPIASLDIGLNSISTSMDDVRENLSKLSSIQQSLQNINADQLLQTLTSNPNKITELSNLVSKAATLYDNNKALLDFLDNFATPQNLATIQFLSDYITTADFDGLEEALKVINSIFGNESTGADIQKALELLKQMSEDLNDPQVQQSIKNLPQTIATLQELQTAIDENKELIDALRILADSDVFSTLESALTGIEGSFAVEGISQYANIAGNADEITAKMTAWLELGKRYTIFTTKPANMSSTVVFVYKIDSLKPSVSADSEKNEPEAEESSGLVALFKKFFG
ncbi:MAG: hypothetical protein IK955_04870 [Clostridia bacterium]|nr:hypothetical protein [Clostridia bacterium]